MPRKK
ncbi:hypothetical protein ECEC1870_1416, partial [Escherichia coli EC1870]